MAALILTCCGLLSTRINKKRHERKEREVEYNANFEVLKAENAKRVRQLSDAGVPGYENVGFGASVVETRARGGSWDSHQGRNGRPGSSRTVEETGVGSGGDARAEMRSLPKYDDVVGGGYR